MSRPTFTSAMRTYMPVQHKTAGALSDIVQGFNTTYAYLLAASMLAGTGIGWGAAKLTAHDDTERDTAKKGYDNERLKADIGYLSNKIQQEYAEQNKKLQNAPRSARILTV